MRNDSNPSGDANKQRRSPDTEKKPPNLQEPASEVVQRTATNRGSGSDTNREEGGATSKQTDRPEIARRSADGEKSSPTLQKSGGGAPEKSGSTKGGGSPSKDGNQQGDRQRTHEQN